MPCENCKSQEADLELPCKHFICTGCSRGIPAAAERTYGLVCPNEKCRARFSMAKEPHSGKKIPAKDEYSIEIQVSKDNIMHRLKKIMGMTILESKLYVVCGDPKHVIFKYDISVSGQTDKAPVELSISEMKWPRGIASSESHGCLYITDWHTVFGGKLWRYNCTKEHHIEDPVAILDVQPFGVSVSHRNEVLVTCATPVHFSQRRGWIYVYEPNGDRLQRTRVIELPGLEIPRHSILTSSSSFLVCHGWTFSAQHGVTSFLDQPAGTVTKNGFYGKPEREGFDQFAMNRPLSMALDKDGLVLVVDYENHRIQLLTENLYLVRHLITNEKHLVEYPRHVCVDPNTGRIYVGQEDGKIIVFDGR